MSDFNLQTKGLFGRYCRIEMFRYGVPNEFYIHKIVSQNRTNIYCDVPLKWDSKPEKHETKEAIQVFLHYGMIEQSSFNEFHHVANARVLEAADGVAATKAANQLKAWKTNNAKHNDTDSEATSES